MLKAPYTSKRAETPVVSTYVSDAIGVRKLQRVSPALIIHYAAQRHETHKDSERDDGALAREAADEPPQPAPQRTARRPSENQEEQAGGNVEPEGGRHAG